MHSEEFKRLLHQHFPTQLPTVSRSYECNRLESGHEKLDCLLDVKWPELSIEVINLVSGEYWQLSRAWVKYYLPTFMAISVDLVVELDEYGEMDDAQSSFFDGLFSYWCDLEWFLTEEFDIKKNVFFGLTSFQANLVKAWITALDFEAIDDYLPLEFDHSKVNLDTFLKKVRQLSI